MTRVSFNAPHRHKPIAAVMMVILGVTLPGPAWSLPADYTVEHGAVSSQQPDPQTLHFHIDSDDAILNFNEFSIAQPETVNFHFHNTDAGRILNRVTGGATSEIAGNLLSNGLVALINPAGIHMASTANIQTAGFIASTLDIANSDFREGRLSFRQLPDRLPASVINEGRIVSHSGGLLALLGGHVGNTGSIVAQLGSVVLAAGERVTLAFDPNGELAVAVEEPLTRIAAGTDGKPLSSAIQQEGTISAPGGQVLVSARAVDHLFDQLINQTGLIEAQSVVNRSGRITLVGERGALDHSGTIRADGTSQMHHGGSVFLKGTRIIQRGTITANASGGTSGGASASPSHASGGTSGGASASSSHAADTGRAGTIEVVSAEKTVIAKDSLMEADAATHGDGGRVSVFSSGFTGYEGIIRARGGSEAGDGGFAEVSGQEGMVFRGTVDLTAEHGETGTLLIDPKNITIANGGTDTIGSNDQFNENPTSSVTFSPSSLVTALDSANVTLQANNDITLSNKVDASGNSGKKNLTLRAGRGITLNADIVLRGSFTATANDSGAQSANRDSGSGFFTMAGGTTIDTSNQNKNIVVTMETGPGGTASGNITIANLNAGTGDVDVSNDGTTANSSILRADSSSLVTASTASFDASSSSGGSVGTSSSPIRVTVTKVEAKSHSGGIFLTSPTASVKIGGAALGGLSGLSTLSNGSIRLITTAGSVTTSNNTAANGSGTVTLTADGAGKNLTLSDAVTSGSGAIQLTGTDGVTLSGASADVTTTGTYTVNADGDANGTGTYSQTANGTAVSSGAVSITAADVVLTGTINSDSANVTLLPSRTTATLGIGDTTKNFNISNAEIGQITTTGTLTIGAASNTGGITLGTAEAINASAKNVELVTQGTLAVNATRGITTMGNLTLTADGMNLSGAAISGGNVTLRPDSAGTTIGVEDNSKTLSLTDAELDTVSTSGTLTIGISANTGGITIATDAALTQGSKNVTFLTGGALAMGTNNFTTTGNVTLTADADGNGSGAITTGAGVVAGNLLIASAAQGIALNTNVTTLNATNSTSGNISVAEANGVDLSGLTTSAGNGSITVTTTAGSITTSGALSANGSGSVTLTAGGSSNGMTLNAAVNSGSGNVQLTAPNGVMLSGASADVTTTGTYTVNADSDASGSGTYTQNNAGSAVSSGAVNVTAADVALTGTINSGSADVTLTPSTGTTIGLGTGAGTFNLTDTELDQVTTTGTLTIGSGAAGAIAVDGLTQGAKNITLLSGSTINDNDDVGSAVVTTGTLTLTSGGAIGNLGGAAGLNTDVGSLTVTSTGGNNVTVTGAGNLSLATVNAGTGSVTLTAATSITDTNAALLNITGGAVSLTAAGGIGSSGDAIETDAGNWVLSAGTGGIFLKDLGDVAVTSVAIPANASVDLQANGTLGLGSALGVTGSGTLSLTADADGNGTGSLTQAAGQNLTSDGGAITVTVGNAASGGADLLIRTIHANGGPVTLISRGGAIPEAESGASDIQAGTLTLTSATGMGTSASPVKTTVGTLTADVTGTGDSFIRETDSLTLTSVTTANGNLTVTSGGSLSLVTVDTHGGFHLDAGGDILDANGDSLNLTATADSTLAARGVIGTIADPIEVSVTGANLSVGPQSQVDGVSANLSGAVSPSNTLGLLNTPPGQVLFNGQKVFTLPLTPGTLNAFFGQLTSAFFAPENQRRTKSAAS